MVIKMIRGFEEVIDTHKQHGQSVTAHGKGTVLYPETILPRRADAGSAGYDISTPVDISIAPGETKLVWTNVKSYMKEDEVLLIYVRSSIGVKQNVVLANGTGVVDASYYSNPGNDGNIAIALKNTTGQTKSFKAGERIAQGIFTKFLVADVDNVIGTERTGGIGSSGTN